MRKNIWGGYFSGYFENGHIAWYEPSIILIFLYKLNSLIEKIPIRLLKYPLLFILIPVYMFCQIFLGIVLPRHAKIGKGIRIYHYSGIVINPNVVIGMNCSIRQNVTIGNRKTKNDCPIIGDNCDIGAGAKIIGAIKIGNNVSIGANAVVLTDVPDNATAVGVPAKIILKKS